MTIKPRIKLVRAAKVFGGHTYWQCSSIWTNCPGGGNTPASAYRDWLENNSWAIKTLDGFAGETR